MRIIIFVLLFQINTFAKLNAQKAISDYENHILIEDTAGKSLKEVLMFVGSHDIIELQSSVIRSMPNVSFKVMLSNANEIYEKDYKKVLGNVKNVEFINYPRPLTDWTQDRIIRFYDLKDGRPSPITVLADHLWDNEYSPFELGAFVNRGDHFSRSTHPNNYVQRHVVDSYDASIYDYSEIYKSWFKGESWRLSYGDGGDRLVTKTHMFVGKSTYDQMIKKVQHQVDLSSMNAHEFMQRLFKKKIVAIDSERLDRRYKFHIDVYMSMIDEKRVIIGSPKFTMKEILGVNKLSELPKEFNKSYWQKNIERYNVVKKQLEKEELTIIEVPMLFIPLVDSFGNEREVSISFANGIYDENRFHSTDYEIDNPKFNNYISKSEKVFTKIMKEQGIETILHEGAENSLFMGGEVRCTSAVLNNID